MNGLFEAAKEVCEFMSSQQWQFCIIGGVAVQRWGEPRTTLDVDLNLLTGFGDEVPYVTAILQRFSSRMSNALEFATARRVMLIRASDGKDVDISLGALPFEADMVRRAVLVEVAPGLRLPFCTSEDLFIMKAFADRPRDWVDAEGIVNRQRRLDRDFILEQLAALCELKEAPEIVERARGMLEKKP